MTKTAGERLLDGTMWGKSREKKAMGKYYARNFGTGHVEVDEYHLSRVGLRGRKRWILLSAVILGYIFVLGHLAVTSMLLRVLKFDASGPPYFEFMDNGVLRWPEGASIPELRLDGSIEPLDHQSLAMKGENNKQVLFTSGSQRFNAIGNSVVNSSQVTISQSEMRFSPFNTFSVDNSGAQSLSVNSSVVIIDSLSGVRQVTSSNGITTSSVRVPVEGLLTVDSESGHVSLLGSNGVSLAADGDTEIYSHQNLELRASLGSITLEGEAGMYLRGLPTTGSSSTYHICACTSNGRLFLVPSNPDRCAIAMNNSGNICSFK